MIILVISSYILSRPRQTTQTHIIYKSCLFIKKNIFFFLKKKMARAIGREFSLKENDECALIMRFSLLARVSTLNQHYHKAPFSLRRWSCCGVHQEKRKNHFWDQIQVQYRLLTTKSLFSNKQDLSHSNAWKLTLIEELHILCFYYSYVIK